MSQIKQTAARNYKDRVFRMLFREKKELLELYNAMNDTMYQNPDDLEITTLDSAIFLGMKNDISFILCDELMMYEHQSTDCPNIPLRDLYYVADVYSSITPEEKLYGAKLQKIPEPKFVVFYNGKEALPERSYYRLSDAYKTVHKEEGYVPELELKVLVLNINPGYNESLKEKSATLKGYMIYVDKVRTYSGTMSREKAVDRAIDECIAKGVLVEFLRTNRAEVKKMSIYTYDEEKVKEVWRQEAWEDGREEGLAAGLEEGRTKGYKQGIEQGIEQGKRKMLLEQIHKKLEKKQSPAQIAEALEEDVEEIQRIIRELS